MRSSKESDLRIEAGIRGDADNHSQKGEPTAQFLQQQLVTSPETDFGLSAEKQEARAQGKLSDEE